MVVLVCITMTGCDNTRIDAAIVPADDAPIASVKDGNVEPTTPTSIPTPTAATTTPDDVLIYKLLAQARNDIFHDFVTRHDVAYTDTVKFADLDGDGKQEAIIVSYYSL